MVIGAVLTIGVVFIFSYFYRAFGTRSHFYINEKMNSSRGDGLGGAGIVMTPKSGSYENVVIWMHGLGDTADGWAQASMVFV